jgi:hypothetical protein
MKQIIIVYDLQFSLINRRKVLEDKIRTYGQYAFVTSNACIIFTTSTVFDVRNNLMIELGIGDKLFVSEVSAPAAWTNSIDKRVSDYLIACLK